MCDDLHKGDGYKEKNEKFKCVENNIQYLNTFEADILKESKVYKTLTCDSMKLKVSKDKKTTAWVACHTKSKIAFNLNDCQLINTIKKGTKEDILKCIQNPNTDKIEITRGICEQIYPYVDKDQPTFPINKADLITLNERYACFSKLV